MFAGKPIDGPVLVTGAGGFIGSHLVEELVRRGISVRAFVRYNSQNSWGWLDHSPPEIRKSLEVVAGDIRDPALVREAVRGCRTVFHLAAVISIPYSYHAADSCLETNIRGTLNVLEAGRECGVGRVIQTSTSEVYGTARYVPIPEEHPLQPQSPYAATKIGADQLALSFHRSFGLPVSVVRPFNTYGPRQSARAIIPAIIVQIANGSRTLRLGNLHPTRDFSHVADTARGFLAAAESPAAVGEVFNLGSGHEISIGETARLIAEVMGAEVDIVVEESRLRPEGSEVERLLADNSKARRLLGWEPSFAGREGFRRGLSETVEWFSRGGFLARYKSEIYNI
jgi:dTDP-glucose 4,6-dehydratase